MNTSSEPLKEHDYNQNIEKLVLKGAELKKRSRQLNAQLDATFKQCDQLLRPGRDHDDKAKQ